MMIFLLIINYFVKFGFIKAFLPVFSLLYIIFALN